MKTMLPRFALLAALLILPARTQAELTVADIIAHMAERMTALESLEQQAEMVVTFEMGGEQEEMIQASTLLYQRPDKVLIQSEMATIVSDGRALTIAFEKLGYFIQNPIEESLSATVSAEEHLAGGMALPDVSALLSADPRAHLAELAEDLNITVEGEADRNGRPAWLVVIHVEDEEIAPKDGVRVWIDQETGLMSGMAALVDLSEYADTAAMEGAPKSYTIDYRLKSVHVNEPLAEDRFAYDTSQLTQIADFEELTDKMGEAFAHQMPDAIEVGAEAPGFELTLLDGTSFSMSDQRGKVVLVDFWATWCPPCVESLPHLQSMYEELAGDNLVFVGVSLDRPGMKGRVEKMVKDKNIGYLIGISEDSSIASDYGAVSIPTLVIVDRDGIVRHQKVGFSPAGMAEVKDVLKSLLSEE